MRTRNPAKWLILATLTTGRLLAQESPVNVDPTELERRADLVGKLITVDDRMLYYVFRQGKGYDQLRLKRTGITFKLPPALRPDSPPRPTPLVVQGRLRKEEGQLVVEVSSIKVVPADLARLDQAIAALPARDFENRKAWAAWAEKRGRDFKDTALIQRAEAIETEALRIQADQSRGAVDAPAEWLRLAEEARQRKLPEPEPSALAHRALRARLSTAETVEGARDLLAAVNRFFPHASADTAAGRANLARWDEPYARDPAATYRMAPADARKGLDRRLWADVLQKQLELQAAQDPRGAVSLASRAEAELPERPRAASTLLEQGLNQASADLGALRLSEVKDIGQAYRDKLHNPEQALKLYRDWLKLQRDRLSPTDAEGPVDLASLYEELLRDRGSARDLLERAWRLDPGSATIAEAFRSRGYRRVKDTWVEDPSATAVGDAAGGPAPAEAGPNSRPGRGLRGMTPDEVTQQIRSAPDRKVLSGTKGQLVEQWIYRSPTQRGWRYVNFVRTPGDLLPRVVSDFTLPENALPKGVTPGR